MRAHKVFLLATTVAFGAPVAASAMDPVSVQAAVDTGLTKDWPELDALYKDIHAHPELSLHETRTAALLATTMRKLGFTVTEKVGGTGIVALYTNGPGPVVMIRTELDALPMEEKTGLAYASHVQAPFGSGSTFVAHSCGHDNHMAWWVGTAEALLALKSQWHGTLMFVGQEAEEAGGGARRMLADGLFTRPTMRSPRMSATPRPAR
jgi:amidohydrolase